MKSRRNPAVANKRRRYENANPIGGMTPDGWHTRSQAAKLVGRDPDTLKRWHRKARTDPYYNPAAPSGHMMAGALKVWLYSDEDIEKMRVFADNQRPGGRKQAV
jgi:hypothetical protein